MKNLKKVLIICVLMSVVLTAFGCKKLGGKSKEETPTAVTYSEEEWQNVQQEIAQLEDELSNYDPKYKSQGSYHLKNLITAGKWAYNKIADKIVLKGEIISDDLAAVSTTGLEATINLGDTVSIPTTNWVIKADTSEVNVCIPEHAYGLIKIYSYLDNDFNPDATVDDYIKPFFDKNDIEISTTRDIYIAKGKIGGEASGNIEILDSTTNGTEMTIPATSIFEREQLEAWGLGADSDVNIKVDIDESKKTNGTIRAGIANAGGTLIYYQFLTTSASGKNQVDSLINGIVCNGSNIYLR